MRLREWFRPPRHALLLFLGVAVVCGVALGWLGWQLLEQDQAVEVARRRERVDEAADRAVAVMQRSLADLEARLGQRTMSGSLPAGVTVVAGGENGITAVPGFLYYPETVRLPEAAAGAFVEAERLEFTVNDLAGAARIYERMAGAADAPTRAGALTRLGRVERKVHDTEVAEGFYARLAQIAHAGVAGLPASLIAREGRASLFAETHRTGDLVREAAALQRDLRDGRWQLTKQQYDFYLSESAAWLGRIPPDDSNGRVIAEAFERVWRNRAGDVPLTRRLISVDRSTALVIWRQSGNQLEAAIAGPRYLRALGSEAIPGSSLRWSIADPEGRTVLGEAPPARDAAVRAAASRTCPGR